MAPRTLIPVLATFAAVFVFGWYEIDRSAPLAYQDAWYEALPADSVKVGERITSARAGQTVILALKIKWPRTNCSTELQRTFVSGTGKDQVIYKVGENARFGPPPVSMLDADMANISRRKVVIPDELPPGIARHSPNAWMRCTSPAQKWGDYLTDVWPIFVGPTGADAQIEIRR